MEFKRSFYIFLFGISVLLFFVFALVYRWYSISMQDKEKLLQSSIVGEGQTGISEEQETSVLVAELEWKEFRSLESYPIYTTHNWHNDFVELRYASASYSFDYPPSWRLSSSNMFEDEFGYKAATFVSGLVQLGSNQQCFDDVTYDVAPWSEPLPKVEFISKEDLRDMDGVKLVEKGIFEGGFRGGSDWGRELYLKSYCVSTGEYAFVITFLDTDVKTEYDAWFDRVARSFQLHVVKP